jgi:hypothetical protein
VGVNVLDDCASALFSGAMEQTGADMFTGAQEEVSPTVIGAQNEQYFAAFISFFNSVARIYFYFVPVFEP